MTTAELQALLEDANCVNCMTNASLAELIKIALLNQISGAQPKVYRALLTQTGTNPPVATVLENTLGGVPVWSRTNVGKYTLTLANAFPTSKTFITIGGTLTVDSTIDSGYIFGCVMASNTSSALKLETGTVSGAGSDDLLFNTPIQILVYP